MNGLVCQAAKARLEAANALREVCEGRQYPATALRMAYVFDPFKPVPADLADLARELDGGE